MQAFAVSVGMCVSLWQRFVDKFMDGSPRGISPPGSHGTERDSLPSLRSSHFSLHPLAVIEVSPGKRRHEFSPVRWQANPWVDSRRDDRGSPARAND